MKRIDDARAVAEAVEGPLMVSIVEGHETTNLTPANLKQMGYCLALYPLSTLFTATRAIQDVLDDLQRNGTTESHANQMATYAEFSDVVRLDHFRGLDDRFGVG